MLLGLTGGQKGTDANTHANPNRGIRRGDEGRAAGHVDTALRRVHA